MSALEVLQVLDGLLSRLESAKRKNGQFVRDSGARAKVTPKMLSAYRVVGVHLGLP